MFLVPQGLVYVSDLLHHLHRAFALPQQPMVLSLQGFTLLPQQHIANVLRDGDRVNLRRSDDQVSHDRGVGERLGRPRAMSGVPSLMALCDSARGSKHVAAPLHTPAQGSRAPARPNEVCVAGEARGAKVVSKGRGSGGLLAISDGPSAPVELPCQSDSVLQVGTSAASSSGGGRKRKPEAMLALPSPSQGNVSAEASAKPSSRTEAKAAVDESASAVVGLPDPDEPSLWKPTSRDPRPGDVIRFRVRRTNGLSGYLAACCTSTEEREDEGVFCCLQYGDGTVENILVDRMLQISVSKEQQEMQRQQQQQQGQQSKRQRGQGKAAKAQALLALPDGSSATTQEQKAGRKLEFEDLGGQVTPAAKVSAPSTTAAAMAAAFEEAHRAAAAPPSLLPRRAPAAPAILQSVAEPASIEEDPEVAAERAQKLRAAVLDQMEHYFGDDNYHKDNFLRAQAFEEGWTSLKFVAKFNRMRELTRDLDLVRESLVNSAVVELSECGDWIRRRGF